MQPILKLKLSPKQEEIVRQSPNQVIGLIAGVIVANADQIGYMLQAYYPREKVSKVMILTDSIHPIDQLSITVEINYSIEEFNACSAIDTEDTKHMHVTVQINQEEGSLQLIGEYWPEA